MRMNRIFRALAGAILLMIIVGMMTGCGKEKKSESEAPLFEEYTDVEEFQTIPALVTAESKIGEADDYGQDNYVIHVDGTTLEDYKNYLTTIKDAGFEKYSDNGKDGMEGYVYSATFTKGELVVVVTYAVKLERTIVSVSEGLKVSEHLKYSDEYVKDNKEGAQTTLHFLPLQIYNGIGMVIQLKNGHFIVHDGGEFVDSNALVEYLQKLTPEGETPIVEAWFISHAHGDHANALRGIADSPVLRKKICVEGFYFFQPADKVENLSTEGETGSEKLLVATKMFKTQAGEQSPLYRPQFGQRYYFNDIEIDVAITLEISPFDDYQCVEFNDTSVYLMHHIEGQKLLATGDGVHTTTRMAMSVYDEEYFDLEVYAVSHHGINVYNYFTDYCTIDTALYPSNRLGSCITDPNDVYERSEANAYFLKTVKEAYSRENGLVVLKFPYTVGTAQVGAAE